jgi:hypothetical protein
VILKDYEIPHLKILNAHKIKSKGDEIFKGKKIEKFLKKRGKGKEKGRRRKENKNLLKKTNIIKLT